MKVDERNRYTDEERSMIMAHMLDLPVDRLQKVDSQKLMWLKLKKIHDDISDRAQITATQHRWLAFFALVLAGLSSSVPQIWNVTAAGATLSQVWPGLISPVVGFFVASYIVLRPLYVEKRQYERDARNVT